MNYKDNKIEPALLMILVLILVFSFIGNIVLYSTVLTFNSNHDAIRKETDSIISLQVQLENKLFILEEELNACRSTKDSIEIRTGIPR